MQSKVAGRAISATNVAALSFVGEVEKVGRRWWTASVLIFVSMGEIRIGRNAQSLRTRFPVLKPLFDGVYNLWFP